MSFYYTYIVELGQHLSQKTEGALRMLDYGCGSGEIVELALSKGLDAYGVELFYEGGSTRARVKERELWQTRIFELESGGSIPMLDSSFDVVTANQVFEHIDDFSIPLREIDRVLKPGGVFINVFPSDIVWREGHTGIPFCHWMRRDSRHRYNYMLALRALGLGSHKGSKTRTEWTAHKLKWIDTWTFYKPLEEIVSAFGAYFTVERRDADYIVYRIERHPALKHVGWLARRGLARPLLGAVAARLAGHVFVLRKRRDPGS